VKKFLTKSLVWIGYLAVLLLLPQFFDSILAISLFNQMAIAIVFALSYNMLLGQGGMLSFGHAGVLWSWRFSGCARSTSD
jgi:branched-chain amino acid transport system permease protein